MTDLNIQITINKELFLAFYYKEKERLLKPKEILVRLTTDSFIEPSFFYQKDAICKITFAEESKESYGVILASNYLGQDSHQNSIYELHIYSNEKQLDNELKTKVYIHEDIKNIIQNSLLVVYKNKEKILWKVHKILVSKPCILQNNESDLHFIQKLLIENELYYFLDDDCIVISDVELSKNSSENIKILESSTNFFKKHTSAQEKNDVYLQYTGEGLFLAKGLLSCFSYTPSNSTAKKDNYLFFTKLDTEIQLETDTQTQNKYITRWTALNQASNIFYLENFHQIKTSFSCLIPGIIESNNGSEIDLDKNGLLAVYFSSAEKKHGSSQSTVRLPRFKTYAGSRFGLDGAPLKDTPILAQFFKDSIFIAGINDNGNNDLTNEDQQEIVLMQSASGFNLAPDSLSLSTGTITNQQQDQSQISIQNDNILKTTTNLIANAQTLHQKNNTYVSESGYRTELTGANMEISSTTSENYTLMIKFMGCVLITAAVAHSLITTDKKLSINNQIKNNLVFASFEATALVSTFVLSKKLLPMIISLYYLDLMLNFITSLVNFYIVSGCMIDHMKSEQDIKFYLSNVKSKSYNLDEVNLITCQNGTYRYEILNAVAGHQNINANKINMIVNNTEQFGLETTSYLNSFVIR